MELGRFLRESEWFGRENELVNLFAHSFLAGRAGPDGPIHATQLGIEVAVKQIRDGKDVVRKDLVIWKSPNETLWLSGKPVNKPLAVIEFKRNNEKDCVPDLEWLAAYTKANRGVLGYSVCGFINHLRGVSFTRFADGAEAFRAFSPADVLPRTVKKGKFASDYVRIAGDAQPGTPADAPALRAGVPSGPSGPRRG